MGRTDQKSFSDRVPRHALVLAIVGVVMVAAATLPSLGQAPAQPVASTIEKRPLGSPPHARALDAPGGSPTAAGALSSGGSGGSGGGGVLRTVLALGAVIGVILVSAALVRKFGARAGVAAALGPGGPSPAGLLEILGRYPVARGQTLVLLKLDRRILLLSQSAGSRAGLRGGTGGFTTLCEISHPEEVASILTKAQDAAGESLAAKFNSLLSRHARDPDTAEAKAPPPTPQDRTIRTSPAGDRVELLRSRKPAASAPAVATPRARTNPAPAESLRQRLAAMRAESGGARR